MDRTQVLIALIGSAAVGALISSLLTMFAQWRERKSRREELALTKAIEMTHSQVSTMLNIFKETGQSGKIGPPFGSSSTAISRSSTFWTMASWTRRRGKGLQMN